MSRSAEHIFHEARGMPPSEQAAFFKGACGGDAALRAKVEALQKADAEAGDVRRTSGEASPTTGAAAAATIEAPLREGPGTRIGPYKLLQLVGEGGFGSVFMAEQEKPVARKVALKIIKLGMDTRQVIARFEAERQALAMMDHPNIARVLDAGATDTGRPYFVMELVKGDPIVEYCDKNNLSIPDRLEIFAQVCTAVQHAHTKGIIHRDIKPSNILVSTQDSRPSAKVIDFGIAKATASKLTEKTLFTEHKALIGTPEYMSPEQAEGSLDIDTRTDVYSLGVLLYELLTGTTPFTSNELRSAAYAEIQRIIREVEPQKPSTRLSANTATLGSVAAHRHTEPKRLGTLIRGELDWIVMKALEKDRQRRYETANGLGMDIRRFLSGDAVVAAPPGAAYRFKKFIRRNRVMVGAGGAVAAALLIGFIAFAWQAKVARDQRDIAVNAQQAEAEQRKLADAATAEARKQADIAEAVARFQTDMLAAADPEKLLGHKVTVVQAMEAAVKELDKGSLKDQPLVEAGVRNSIGVTFLSLGRFDDAEPNLRKSLALLRAALPAGHPDIAEGLNNLAGLLFDQNKSAEAETLLREALAIRRAALPAGHLDIAITLNNLAVLLHNENRLAEAEPFFREALAIRRAALPAGHPSIATGLSSLAGLLQAQNKPAEAEPFLREALANRRAALPAGHPDIATSLNNLAGFLYEQNKPDEAEAFFREGLAIRRGLPAGHPDIGTSLVSLGTLLFAQNKSAEAEPLFREAVAIFRPVLPAGHPHLVTTLNSLARAQHALGMAADARAAWNEAIASLRSQSPEGSALFARVLWRSGSARLEHKEGVGDAAAALPELEQAVAMAEKFLPAEHPQLKEYRETLAKCKAALAEQARPGADGSKR